MKTYSILLVAIAGFSPVSALAQGYSAPVKMGITQLISEAMTNDDQVIVAYRVEERINMNFGGRVTTYTVTSLDMVSKIDLGPNNTRTITPIYAKARAKAVEIRNAPLNVASFAVSASANVPHITVLPKPRATTVAKAATVANEAPAAVNKVTSVNIDILYTYERTLERGYRSVEMLRRVANARFFEGDLVKSAKWYSQLFEMTSDIEPVIYFRYAQSLKAINQLEKANEMMKVWEAKK